MHVPQFKLKLAVAAMALACPLVQAAAHGWEPVASAVLASQRGGFAGASGLLVSLGIERMVTVNGATVLRTTLDLPDVTRLTPEQARETGAALAAVKLIQVGSGNMVLAAMPDQMPGGTVIQNTLNDQRIDSHTLISASVNSTQLLNTLHFHGNLGDAIARAAGP